MPDSIEDQINEAMRSGAFDNLPNKGKPLSVDEDPNTPRDMQLAHRVLKQNDLAPAWVEEARTLREEYTRLIAAIHSARSVSNRLRDEVNSYNKQALTHNLKVPQGVPHQRIINLERELSKR